MVRRVYTHMPFIRVESSHHCRDIYLVRLDAHTPLGGREERISVGVCLGVCLLCIVLISPPLRVASPPLQPCFVTFPVLFNPSF